MFVCVQMRVVLCVACILQMLWGGGGGEEHKQAMESLNSY